MGVAWTATSDSPACTPNPRTSNRHPRTLYRSLNPPSRLQPPYHPLPLPPYGLLLRFPSLLFFRVLVIPCQPTLFQATPRKRKASPLVGVDLFPPSWWCYQCLLIGQCHDCDVTPSFLIGQHVLSTFLLCTVSPPLLTVSLVHTRIHARRHTHTHTRTHVHTHAYTHTGIVSHSRFLSRSCTLSHGETSDTRGWLDQAWFSLLVPYLFSSVIFLYFLLICCCPYRVSFWSVSLFAYFLSFSFFSLSLSLFLFLDGSTIRSFRSVARETSAPMMFRCP